MFKASFTPDEWLTLQFAPLWMFHGVAAVDGNVDQKEIAALVKEMADWAQYKEPLVQEVFLSVLNEVAALTLQYKRDGRNVVDGLKAVAAILSRKATPEQSKNFKGALFIVGKNVAAASGGGFFGLGDKVSDQEKLAIVALMQAMDYVP